MQALFKDTKSLQKLLRVTCRLKYKYVGKFYYPADVHFFTGDVQFEDNAVASKCGGVLFQPYKSDMVFVHRPWRS